MNDKLERYRRADAPLPTVNRLWPLYGAGFENFGVDNRPIAAAMPIYGPDEILVRQDACGLCASDVKALHAGQNPQSSYRDLRRQPIVLGREVSVTVVGVGAARRAQYHVGDRFTLHPDSCYQGQACAYGIDIDGGLATYALLDRRILDGDHGNHLIPIPNAATGYAEAALTAPWACVIAAYQLRYRAAPRANGTMWIIGAPNARTMYNFSQGFDQAAHPARLLLTDVPAGFAVWLRERAAQLGIAVEEIPAAPALANARDDTPVSPAADGNSDQGVDDIILLGADPDLIERASPHLAPHGILAIMADAPLPRPVKVDVGRIRHNRWLYAGSAGADIAKAYNNPPVRAALKPGGRAWFVGAGGPIGRMHVQAALQSAHGPAVIVCTDGNDARLEDLHTSFSLEARRKGVTFICLNPTHQEACAAVMAPFQETGFDDILILVPDTPTITDSATYLAPHGVLNVFADVPRGDYADLDLSAAYLKQARIIGHSGTPIEAMRLMLEQTETGQLAPNRSVAAIGSLEAAYDGLKAVDEARFSGQIILYPHIKPLPLTALTDLKDVLPTVAAKLKDGCEWTTEAENELLQVLL